MCVRKISGSVEMWGRTCSSLLQSQIFYVYRPRPHVFRGSGEEAPGKRSGTGGGSIQWVVEKYIGLCAKGAGFSADIAQVDGAWAPGRSQHVFLRRMSVDFSVDPISAFLLRGAGLSPRRLIRTSLPNGNAAF